MSLSHVADVHDVQTRVDKSRHRAAHEIDHHLAGRRGLEIMIAHGRCRIYGHHESIPDSSATRSASNFDRL